MRKPKPTYVTQRQWEKVFYIFYYNILVIIIDFLNYIQINEIDNPDPSKYEPTIVHGLQELKARYDLQVQNTKKLSNYVEDIRSTIQVLENASTNYSTRVEELQHKQIRLNIKLLEIIGRIEVLRCRCTPLRESEIKYREKLEQILAVLTSKHHQLIELMNLEVLF